MPILPHIFKKGQQKETQAEESIREKQKKQATHEKNKKRTEKTDSKKGGDVKKTASSAIKAESAHKAYQVLVKPHISEKSVMKNDEGKYVFEVYPEANKNQIAQAVESIYGVKVEKVNKINVRNKNKRYRYHRGSSLRNNKAVITLRKGQEIEVLPH